MYKKKGQQMTLGTIIAIVLGLVVLVFLIYGFSTGWGNLWDKVTGIGGGEINVGTVRTSCILTCQQGNQYGFCSQERDLVIDKGKSTTGSCFDFASKNKVLGIEDCAGLCSVVSTGCISEGKEDKDCDGVGAGVVAGATGSVGDEGAVGLSGSGAIAITLPQESLDISYAVITSDEDSFSGSEEVFT